MYFVQLKHYLDLCRLLHNRICWIQWDLQDKPIECIPPHTKAELQELHQGIKQAMECIGDKDYFFTYVVHLEQSYSMYAST